MLPEQAAHQVGGAAGRRRNDDAHRLGRAPLGLRGAGQGGRGGEASGSEQRGSA
jgi:hypothetical protein